jgi:hypothetical protein
LSPICAKTRFENRSTRIDEAEVLDLSLGRVQLADQTIDRVSRLGLDLGCVFETRNNKNYGDEEGY